MNATLVSRPPVIAGQTGKFMNYIYCIYGHCRHHLAIFVPTILATVSDLGRLFYISSTSKRWPTSTSGWFISHCTWDEILLLLSTQLKILSPQAWTRDWNFLVATNYCTWSPSSLVQLCTCFPSQAPIFTELYFCTSDNAQFNFQCHVVPVSWPPTYVRLLWMEPKAANTGYLVSV